MFFSRHASLLLANRFFHASMPLYCDVFSFSVFINNISESRLRIFFLLLITNSRIMNYPTGMSASTGNHYHNVAAQMHAYLNNGGSGGGGGQGLRAAGGHVNQFQPSRGLAFASNVFQGGASQFGVNPVIANDVGGFARKFMRNLLH